jgi:hypothetical protein
MFCTRIPPAIGVPAPSSSARSSANPAAAMSAARHAAVVAPPGQEKSTLGHYLGFPGSFLEALRKLL